MEKYRDIKSGEEGITGKSEKKLSTLHLFEGEVCFDTLFNSSPISSI